MKKSDMLPGLAAAQWVRFLAPLSKVVMVLSLIDLAVYVVTGGNGRNGATMDVRSFRRDDHDLFRSYFAHVRRAGEGPSRGERKVHNDWWEVSRRTPTGFPHREGREGDRAGLDNQTTRAIEAAQVTF
ncbi:hypothetical protein [Cryobacterium sp. TMT3-29-2]|uniref:hypothetical protein n=1 Tax=Cryobacterium sp. TMT3-29-2 TaxID=2555867 RepID=UPI00107361D6|nr:hypothetical protein [Cryobacterium sp. TMT3-29-2]TFC84266.1 hypothetical protein E3O67_13715 [Cryobacterium sp. TMT3-29-2]